ncbi:Benzoyl-CoA oxygenase component A [compost metagenome]
MDMAEIQVIKQHLIDPEICIRCNTCEATCPVGAITHDSRNYVVDADKCNLCMACISPCPTGSIDNWRDMPKLRAYSIEEQLTWDTLPEELSPEQLADLAPGAGTQTAAPEIPATSPLAGTGEETFNSARYGATVPPWSAAHAYTNVYGAKSAHKTITATVTGNVRVTDVGREYDTHHIVLDFGATPFPVLEGQSIGIVPPGTDASGRPHHARQYSIASARNGERPGYNNLSLTIKRVLQDHDGNPVRGVGSNYMCDLKVGDKVEVIGPFGASFLMPNHPRSNIVMQNLPKDFIDINLAFSRTPGQPKRYVQDLMRERAADLAALLASADTYFYVCGLKSMEEGVVLALRDVAQQAGLNWESLAEGLKRDGRLHLETY